MYYMYHVPLWHDQHLQSWLMATAEDADKLPTEHSKFNSSYSYHSYHVLSVLWGHCIGDVSIDSERNVVHLVRNVEVPRLLDWLKSHVQLHEEDPQTFDQFIDQKDPKGKKTPDWNIMEHLCLRKCQLMGSPDIRSRREKNGCKWKSGGSWHSAPATLHQAVLSSLCKVSNVRKMIKTAYDSWLPVGVASSSVQTPDLWLTKD